MDETQQSSTRRRKVSDGEQIDFSIDRLSDLPDTLIWQILSYLPTKLCVRTSILGRRWRYLWAYVPNLYFDRDNHNFIDKVMLMHKLQSINTFRLSSKEYSIGAREYQFQAWIDIAIDRNVRNIDLCFTGGYRMLLKSNRLLTCKTLVDLSLENCRLIPNIGSAVYLPHLKKLHLMHVYIEADESLSDLISGCPVLEELVIELLIDYHSCKISSPTLKRLMVDLRSECDDSVDGDHYTLEINAPALVYLQLFDESAHHIKIKPLTSLIEADVHIQNFVESQDDCYSLYFRSVAEFIDGLHNVKCLKLNLSNIALPQLIDSLFSSSMTKRFHNLIKFELTGHCWFLSKFLGNADNLEILILSRVGEGRKRWMEPRQVPTCVLSHLKTIRLCEYVYSYHEVDIIRYLLKNAKVLEMMEIPYGKLSYATDHQIDIFRYISMFERGSRACKVALIN